MDRTEKCSTCKGFGFHCVGMDGDTTPCLRCDGTGRIRVMTRPVHTHIEEQAGPHDAMQAPRKVA